MLLQRYELFHHRERLANTITGDASTYGVQISDEAENFVTDFWTFAELLEFGKVERLGFRDLGPVTSHETKYLTQEIGTHSCCHSQEKMVPTLVLAVGRWCNWMQSDKSVPFCRKPASNVIFDCVAPGRGKREFKTHNSSRTKHPFVELYPQDDLLERYLLGEIAIFRPARIRRRESCGFRQLSKSKKMPQPQGCGHACLGATVRSSGERRADPPMQHGMPAGRMREGPASS